jgi:hypothetical protein
LIAINIRCRVLLRARQSGAETGQRKTRLDLDEGYELRHHLTLSGAAINREQRGFGREEFELVF